MNSLTLYLITRLDTVKTCSVIGTLLLLATLAVLGLFCLDKKDKHSEVGTGTKRLVKQVAAGFAICLMGAVLVPTTKEMAAILILPKIANNETVQDLGMDLVDLSKAWLKELHPDNVHPDNVKVADEE
jgi:hypothetical protein